MNTYGARYIDSEDPKSAVSFETIEAPTLTEALHIFNRVKPKGVEIVEISNMQYIN